MDGEEVRRSYSICSGPEDGELRIAVKKVDGGAFSNWAAEELKAGDELDVMTPTGRFGVGAGAGGGAHLCRLCGRLRHHADPVDRQGVLAHERQSRFFLFYGNRSTSGVLFPRGPGRAQGPVSAAALIFHVISGEEQDIPILHGRLDAAKVKVLLRSLVAAETVDHVFICGPAA